MHWKKAYTLPRSMQEPSVPEGWRSSKPRKTVAPSPEDSAISTRAFKGSSSSRVRPSLLARATFPSAAPATRHLPFTLGRSYTSPALLMMGKELGVALRPASRKMYTVRHWPGPRGLLRLAPWRTICRHVRLPRHVGDPPLLTRRGYQLVHGRCDPIQGRRVLARLGSPSAVPLPFNWASAQLTALPYACSQ